LPLPALHLIQTLSNKGISKETLRKRKNLQHREITGKNPELFPCKTASKRKHQRADLRGPKYAAKSETGRKTCNHTKGRSRREREPVKHGRQHSTPPVRNKLTTVFYPLHFTRYISSLTYLIT